MIVLGVDPGLTGAIAVFDTVKDKYRFIIDIPTQDRGYGSGKEVDWAKLREDLDETLDLCCEGDYVSDPEDVVYILENVGVMPKQGAVSGFQFGRVIGGLEAMFAVMEIPGYRIHPATWKAKFGLVGTNKSAAVTIVNQTLPECRAWLTLAKHHNRADAILIAAAGTKLL